MIGGEDLEISCVEGCVSLGIVETSLIADLASYVFRQEFCRPNLGIQYSWIGFLYLFVGGK